MANFDNIMTQFFINKKKNRRQLIGLLLKLSLLNVAGTN